MTDTAHSRIILSADQRERIANILGGDDEELFLQIEEILTDYNSHKKVLDDVPKAAKARDTFAAISKYAKEGKTHMLGKKINQLHRWAWIDYQVTYGGAEDLEELSKQMDAMSELYVMQKTPRNKDQIRHARYFAVSDLVEMFIVCSEKELTETVYPDVEDYWEKRLSGTLKGRERINPGYLSDCELFVSTVLSFGRIPAPSVSDTDEIEDHGEQVQGRMRRLIKSCLNTNLPR